MVLVLALNLFGLGRSNRSLINLGVFLGFGLFLFFSVIHQRHEPRALHTSIKAVDWLTGFFLVCYGANVYGVIDHVI